MHRPQSRLGLIDFGLPPLAEGVSLEDEKTPYSVHAVVLAPVLL